MVKHRWILLQQPFHMESKYNHLAVNNLVQRLILVQHADTLPAKEGELDIHRALSPWGRIQSRRLGKRLVEKAYNQIDFIFVSPALRADNTMLIAFEEIPRTGALFRTMIEGLYLTPPETGDDIIGDAYKELKYAPYEQYQRFRVCHQLLFSQAEIVLERILDNVGNRMPPHPTNCIVFGHVPLLPALAHAFLKAGTADGSVGTDIRELHELNLGEAEGVSLRLDDYNKNGYVFEHRLIP